MTNRERKTAKGNQKKGKNKNQEKSVNDSIRRAGVQLTEEQRERMGGIIHKVKGAEGKGGGDSLLDNILDEIIDEILGK